MIKRINKIIIVIIVIIFSILFFKNAISIYLETNDDYNYDNFKRTVIRDFHEDRDEFQKNYKYEIGDDEELSDDDIDKIYNIATKTRFINLVAIAIPLSLLEFILTFGPFLFLLLIFLIIKKYNKYRLSIDNFEQNRGYYRDLLKDYNPLELSYNNNYNLDDNSLFAMVLYLQNKKVLCLNDGKFIINYDNVDKLDNLGKQFIDCIKVLDNGKLAVSYSNLTNLTDKSCKEKNLLVMDNVPKRKFIIDLLMSIIIYVVLFVAYKNLATIYDSLPPTENIFFGFSVIIFSILLILSVFVFPFIFFIKLVLFILATNIKQAKKTKLGNDINYKLDGLKNFIRDFSNLDERSKEEVVLWDDYLIYSVLFGDNKKISTDMKDMVEYSYTS